MSAVAYESSFYDTLHQDVLNRSTQTTASIAAKRPPKPQAQIEGECPDFGSVLKEMQWEYWPVDFQSSRTLQIAMKHHLRVHVFARGDAGGLEIVVAFGGTDPRNIWDWFSNLRWLIPWHDDEYTIVVKDFVGAFQRELRRRVSAMGVADESVFVLTVGHSLGGGLAQQLAYAARHHSGDFRISQVYAFDPSPVTGFYSVAREIREQSSKGLRTDRAFEAYEILSYLRWITALFVPPAAHDPAVRGVRYRLLSTEDGIRSHSITNLACALYSAAHRGASEQAASTAELSRQSRVSR
jgi:pimeloyl-ACP methyl ester carboxylesterase